MTLQPLAQAVKHETRSLHEEVENLLLPKLTEIASTDQYAAVLKMFYGYFRPLENLIQTFITPGDLPDICRRRTSSLIVSDLDTLGIPVSALLTCHRLPVIDNTAKAFGALYVLEGSTLGGQMIAKMLAKNKAVPETAVQFFKGYKEETGHMWKAFLDVFNRQEETTQIINTANETFFYMKTWMLLTLCYETNQ